MESAEYKKKELAKMFIQHPGVLTFSCCTEKKKSDFFLLQKQNTTETVCSLIPEKCSVLKCQSFSFSCAACNIQLDSYTNTLKHLKVYKYYQHYFGKNKNSFIISKMKFKNATTIFSASKSPKEHGWIFGNRRPEIWINDAPEIGTDFNAIKASYCKRCHYIRSQLPFHWVIVAYLFIKMYFHFEPFDESRISIFFYHFSLQHMLEILPCENDKPAIFLCSLPFCEVIAFNVSARIMIYMIFFLH